MSPKVSIIMPSLDVCDYIRECIESVLCQTLEDIEVICIDAGSTDGTLEILHEYESKDSRVKLVNSDKKSYGYQMNMAMNQATGKYIGIVETDDYVSKEMFESLYRISDNADVVKGNFFHVFENGEIKRDEGKKDLIKQNVKFTIDDYPAIIKAHPSIWAGIYRREFLIENNILFKEEPGGAWVDNPFFYETAFAAKSIVYTDDAYYYYREFNPTSSTNNLADYTIPIKRMLDNLDVVEKYSTKSDRIFKMVYMRAFAYLRNIERREHFQENLDEVRPLLNEMMLRMDEDYIKRKSSKRDRMEYYKYLSPLRIKKEFSDEEYENLLKENDFLYQTIDELQNVSKKSDNKDSSFKSKLKRIF